jgi:two-component system response regulator HydG
MNTLLIIDDDRETCATLKKCFTQHGYKVFTAASGEEGIQCLKQHRANIVICDSKLPDYTAIDILQKIKILDPKTQVVIITDSSDIRIAVEAVKKGAFDCVTKPLYTDDILSTVRQALDRKREMNSNSSKSAPTRTMFIRGQSPQAQQVQKHINLIADTDMSVIISGESGTGKEFVARAIHRKSKRSNRPFVAIDCGALPRELASSELFGHVKGAFTGAVTEKMGSFELANGGTLFLDEIGNLNHENQAKLLRVLQERVVKKVGGTKDIPVDARVLVATNENLLEDIRKGKFREDIYYRINEFRIEIAPLRQRKDDIVQFADHFLGMANKELHKNVNGFEDDVVERLKAYPWPGNLRELRNIIRQAVLLTSKPTISLDALPAEFLNEEAIPNDFLKEALQTGNTRHISLKVIAERAEREAIMKVLRKTNNNKSKTAKLLKVTRKTLYNKLKV